MEDSSHDANNTAAISKSVLFDVLNVKPRKKREETGLRFILSLDVSWVVGERFLAC
jgi:hypothetical protein